jgi:hypothetical protein
LTIPIDNFRSALHGCLNLEAGSSSARAAPLLLRALAFFNMSREIIEKTSTATELCLLLETLSNIDADAGSWLLERLPAALGRHRSSESLRLELYCCAIQASIPFRVKQCAISGLADQLECMHKSSSSVLDGGLLSMLTSLADPLEKAISDKAGNRDVVNAAVHLQGCIVPLMDSQKDTTANPRLRKLICSLESALRDETVSFWFSRLVIMALKSVVCRSLPPVLLPLCR